MKFYEEKGIAYCGYACVLCKEEACMGCHQSVSEKWGNCSIYQCCLRKKINGCYQCDGFPCEEKLFQDKRIQAFNLYAKEKGKGNLIKCLKDNFQNGVVYHGTDGYKGDYDLFDSVEDIMRLIEFGKDVFPYAECPKYETEHFTIRLVEEKDGEDLLVCYSDPNSQMFFNADNCTSNFQYKTIEEMKECIGVWIQCYQEQSFIRFSIVDKQTNKAIGTIEMFGKESRTYDDKRVGILRLDIASTYEKEEIISEILELASKHFYYVFKVDEILTKAIPSAIQRKQALLSCGYTEMQNDKIVSNPYYFVRSK